MATALVVGNRTSVLITGAAGFLGRWFTRAHLERGDFVLGVDDLSSPYAVWPDELDPLLRYQMDAQLWFKKGLGNAHDEVGLEKWDIVYHFAAPVGGREKIEGDPLFNANSFALDASFFRYATKRATTAIYPSSSAVYGADLQTGAGILLNEAWAGPELSSWLPPDELYGTTKFIGEYLAWKSAKYGLNTLCIRPFSGYGEGQSLEYPIPSILTRAKNHEDPLVIWGSGSQQRDFVHVSDVVGATLARLDAGIMGYQTMNIASGLGTSFFTIAELAAELAGYQPQISADTSKPAGVNARYGSPVRMETFYRSKVGLREGLQRVLDAL